MNKCPNKNSKEWKTLVAQIGEDMAWATWVSNNGEYPETLMSTSELKKALGFRTPCSRDQVINLYERIKKYNSKHNTAHSAPKSQVGQADLYDLRLNIAYMSKDILKKTIDEGHAEVLGTDQARDFINSNPEIFISEGNQYFRDGELYPSYEDAINSSLDYDRPFAEKLFRNYEKDFIPADKDKVYELLALAKNQGISGVLNHIISNTKDPIIKIFAKAFLDNIDRAGFLQIKFDVARDRYGNYVQDASGSYGGGIININWKKVFFNATNLIHKNGLDSGYKSIIHELVHVYTLQALRNPKTSKEKEFKNKITKAYNTLKQDAAFKSDYGLSSVEEFISEIISNPEFRGTLNIYKAGFLAKIINYIAKLFGYTKDISMEESNRASIIHETVNTFLKDLPYLTPSKGKSIYYDKANNIKPGVSELFESNPELADAVYEATGFKPNTIEKDIEDVVTNAFKEKIFRIGKSDFEKTELNDINVYTKKESVGNFSVAIDNKGTNLFGLVTVVLNFQRRDLDSDSIYSPNPNGFILWNKFLDSGIAHSNKSKVIVDNRLSIASGTLMALKNNGIKSIHFPQRFADSFKEEYSQFLKQNLSYVGYVDTSDNYLSTIEIPIDDLIRFIGFKNDINQLIPEQKQQAQQLYSKYLDTIFPESKVKNIVYHGSSEKREELDPSKQIRGRFGKGVSFASTPELVKQLIDNPVIHSAIINLQNPLTDVPHLRNEVQPAVEKGNHDGVQVGKIEYTVPTKEQIHILGSKQDIEGFKEFVKGKQYSKLTQEEKAKTIGQVTKEHRSITALKDLSAKLAHRIGGNVRFDNRTDVDWKGYNQGMTSVLNEAYMTPDTPFHEILAHPIIRAIKNRNRGFVTEGDLVVDKNGNEFKVKYVNEDYDFVLENGNTVSSNDYLLSPKSKTSQLYQSLLKELETGRGKEVLDRIKRDYKYKKEQYKTGKILLDDLDFDGEGNPQPSYSEEVLEKDGAKYTLEKQQEEAIVTLLGLMAADKLDAKKDASLISKLKELWKQISDFIKSLLRQDGIKIDELPITTTLNDLAEIMAYGNNKIILPGYKIEYSTPLGNKYDTLEEVNNEIRHLADANVEVDLSGVSLKFRKPVNNVSEIPVSKFTDEFMNDDFEKIGDTWYYEGTDRAIDDNIIITAWNSNISDNNWSKTGLEGFVEKNKEYEQSKEIIEQWKKENNIQYDPEEVYSRGQGFYSSIGAYSNLELDLLFQNLLQHIADNKKAGGEFTISAFTKPIGSRIKHIEGTGDRVRFVIYPRSEHIKWAAPIDVYSGSVWDAHEKVSKDKKSELLGVSFTKAPSLRNINEVSPNLADIIDNIPNSHNELGIELTTNNFRIEYDDNIDHSTKKLIDNINKILDDKYGKLVKPKIGKKSEKIPNSFIGYANGFKQGLVENKNGVWEINGQIITEEQLNILWNNSPLQGKQPIQTKENTTSIESVKNNLIPNNIYNNVSSDITTITFESTINPEINASINKNGKIRFFKIKESFDFHSLDEEIEVTPSKEIKEELENKIKEFQQKQQQLKKEYTSQAETNLKIAALKEVARKYPRSLITSKVVLINPNLDNNSEIQYSKVSELNNINIDSINTSLMPDSISDNKVNYTFKSFNILMSDKAKQIFDKGNKNKWSLDKILTELAIPKEQKQLLLDLDKNNLNKNFIWKGDRVDFNATKNQITDREQLALELVSQYGFKVEINVGKNKLEVGGWNNIGELSGEEVNSSFYSNLAVPGGVNYTENEISTPLITPSIKGHAQFSTNNGIGWFRSDDLSYSNQKEKETKDFSTDFAESSLLNEESFIYNGDKYELVQEFEPGLGAYTMRTKNGESISHEVFMEALENKRLDFNKTNLKTRRILELQSDLFQKGRNNEFLDKTEGDRFKAHKEWYGDEEGFEGKNSKENQFLQLLNKDNNWVTFFIKSIIQDSAKKGYEKVLFPKGETAARIEGHETLSNEIKRIDKVIKDVELNPNKYFNSKDNAWVHMDTNFTVVEQTKEDFIESLEEEKSKIKLQGIEKLKPIEAFYEIKVGNILEKVYGKNNVKIITDEYGNSWNEITLSDIDSINISLLPSTINDINDGLSSPSNAPSSGNPINKGVKFQPVIDSYLERVKALRNSIGKLKSLRKKSTDPTEKANIYKRIKNLEKAVYEIVSTDKDNPGLIMQVSKLSALEDIIPYADAQLMNVRSILSGNITIENLKYAEKIVALWTKAGDFSKENLFWSKQDLEDLDVNPALENILKEFSRLKTEADIIKSTIINPIRENIAKKGVEEQFGKEATKQISSLIADVNWATMQTLDISEVNNPLVQAMSSYLKKANFNALQEANEIVETIDKLMSKIGKVDWDLFKQTFSNTDSRETGNLVFRFSQSYFDKRAKMLNVINSTNNTKARNSALKELLKFNKENTLIFDVRKLFPDKFNAVYSQDVIDEHIAELKQALGEIGYNEFYTRAEELVGRFLLDKDTQSQIFESEYTKDGVLDNAAYNLALTSWIRQNSPAAEAEAYSLSNKDIDNISVIPNGTYSVKVPKRTINGVNTGYYDNKFSKIEANEDLKELYNTIFSTINELKAVLPYEETKWMHINSLPTVHKTIMDQYAEDGMTAGLQPLIGALAEATRINDVSTIDTRYRNLDTGDPEKSIQTQMLVDYNKRIKEVTRLKIIQYKLSHDNNPPTSEMVKEFSKDAANEIAKEKSFDLAKITKMYALMALSFKHKAGIQHIMESLEMKVKNSQEGATNNTGAQLYDKQGNPLRLSNKLSNINQMLETFMDYYYGYKMDKPIGKTTKKVYTPKEKEKKETIDKALELNEEKFNNKEISIEEYESNKEALTEMLELLGGVRTWSKYGDLFLQYVQIKGMGWNVFAGITNMTYGFISNLIEASDGRNYNQEEFWKAQLKVLHTVGGNKFTDEAVKIRSLVKNLDILKASRYEINNPSNQSKFNKGAKVINPYTPQTSTEFLNQATVMVAMMLHTKVSRDGNEITLYDAFDKNGKLLPGVVLPEGFDIASFKISVDKVIKMNHGNYDPDSPINAKRHLLGRALSQFRTWAYQGFAERFMDEMPDYQLGMIRKGRYRSYVDFYKTMKENGNGYISSTFFITKQLLRKATFGVYNTEFNELQGLSEVDAANMRKNMTELVILGMLTAMALLIKGLVDKKKSGPKYLAYFYINQITRLSTDIMFYTSPSQFEKLTRNAMPAFSAVIDLEDAMRKSINYIVDNESDMIKTGSYKGQSKAFRALNKVIPNPYSGISKVISATESDYSKKPIK